MRKFYFRLGNHYSKLFTAISNCITTYYPSDISSSDEVYYQHPGIKKAEAIMHAFFEGKSHFKPQWAALIEDITSSTKKKIQNTTFGPVPGCSADLILERYSDSSLVRVKRLAFAVSLLGPFYSVCGVDETFIKEKDEIRQYHAFNVLTASPYREFEEHFKLIQNHIDIHFKDYHFIPIDVCLKPLEHIDTLCSSGTEATVYNALFNHLFNYYDSSVRLLRGDSGYGMDDTGISVTLGPPDSLST